jgi:hypothetical protein
MHGGGQISMTRIIKTRRGHFLPRDLQELYEQFAKDPSLYSLDEDLAFVERMIVQKYEAMHSKGGVHALWKQAKDLYARVISSGGKDAAAMKELGDVLSGGVGASTAEKDALGLIERRRKLIETREKQIANHASTMDAQTLNLMVQAMIMSIRQNVSDDKERSLIATDFARILSAAGYIGTSAGDNSPRELPAPR